MKMRKLHSKVNKMKMRKLKRTVFMLLTPTLKDATLFEREGTCSVNWLLLEQQGLAETDPVLEKAAFYIYERGVEKLC